MPGQQKSAAAPKPASPRHIAKYTNKDGSKFITVPKIDASENSVPSTPTSSKPSEHSARNASEPDAAPAINRKKQKRRQKAAAKAAAQQAANGHSAQASSTGLPPPPDPADYDG